MMDLAHAELHNLVLIFLCLVFSAFFSASETAITSLGTLKAKHLLNQKGNSVAFLKVWINYPERILATTLVYNNVVNILASSVATKIAYDHFQDAAIGISTGVMTFLILVFGEVIPKSFAKTRDDRYSLFFLKIIVFIYKISFPLIYVLSTFSSKIIKLISKNAKQAPVITEDELEFLVSEGEKAGVIEKLKKEIIAGAFNFDDTKVKEIMTPRTDLQTLNENEPIKNALNLIIQSGHSRIPIYKDHVDHITGIVLAKDLLRLYEPTNNKLMDKPVKTIMREVSFAPESKSIMGVFKDLKKNKNHLAIIIDEYGGTAGIVTMEDILEEFVGEIQDEYDAEKAELKKIDQNSYEVSGSMNIEEFFDYFGIDIQEIEEEMNEGLEADTIAGWFTQRIGMMPKVGQKIAIKDLKIEVTDVKNKRIEALKCTKGNKV